MTITENTRDNGLSDDAADRVAARARWHASGGTLSGRQLADMFGRPAKWGQRRRAEAMEENVGQSTDTPAPTAPDKPVPSADTPRTRPARARRTQPAASAALVAVTAVAVVVVTAVCAVVSYSHIQHLAASAGMGQLSWWVPLGIDGLVVACSGSLIVDKRAGRPGHPLAWAGVAIGLSGTLAANVLAVDPELVSIRVVRWVLAGYGPVALAVSGHLMLRMLDER